ncbi:FapA family protein [Eubacteriales bacterium OttesenSCG-928-M02]|nr:FapA family protein [Eubacteriales bacterium OttesenSCG-928-M02]
MEQNTGTRDMVTKELEETATASGWGRTPSGKIIPYVVSHEEDGVYLLLPSALPGIVAPTLAIFDLTRRGITGMRPGDLAVRLRKGQEKILIAEAQVETPVPTGVFITTPADGMSATMQLLPPSTGGEMLDVDGVVAILNEEGITHGLLMDAITEAVTRKLYYEEFVIAKGTPSVKGEDGYLVFHFETEHSPAPKILEDGSADFYNLNLYSTVMEGDLLVESIPPGDGTPGVTVRGETVEPKAGLVAKLPRGRNIAISPDGNQLLAAMGGKADYINGSVEVSNVYNIPGNVDMGVGNVDFVGDVEIKGNVIAGLTLKATGTIEINGTVEAATIIAGKDIILKKGIQGMDNGLLQAEGNVVSSFIERANVVAGGSVLADYIVHSTVSAKDDVEAKGKRGRIIGGIIRAGKRIMAKEIGNASGERTTLEMGSAPELRTRQLELGEQMVQTKAQLDKIDSLARVQQLSKDVDQDRQDMWDKLLAGREQLQQNYEGMQQELEEIRVQVDAGSDGKVHVTDTTYPDVRITINSATYTVSDPIAFATFKYSDGAVVFTAYEGAE